MGLSREHIMNSCEYKVRQAYLDILKHEPDVEGCKYWVKTCGSVADGIRESARA